MASVVDPLLLSRPMQVLVFSRSPSSPELWHEVCERHACDVRFLHSLDSEALTLGGQSRVLVFDSLLLKSDSEHMRQLIQSQFPNAIAVICSSNASVDFAVQHMRMGAAWIFSEPLTKAALEAGIECLIEAAEKKNSVYQEYLELKSMADEITPREWEVVDLVLEGTPNKNIAKRLNVSVRTVEARRTKVYRKMQVKNVTGLIRRVDRTEELKNLFQHVLPQIKETPRSVSMESDIVGIQRPSQVSLC